MFHSTKVNESGAKVVNAIHSYMCVKIRQKKQNKTQFETFDIV